MRQEILVAAVATIAACGSAAQPNLTTGDGTTDPSGGTPPEESPTSTPPVASSSPPQESATQHPGEEVEEHDTMYVKGRHLYSACGEQVILRGVNKMNIWTDRDGSRSFPEIAKTGANTVRIVWDTTGTATELDTIIGRALEHGLLPMVELHDATGNWDGLSDLVDYWVSPDVLDVIEKYQRNLLVNIGNEVGGHGMTQDQFEDGYTLAVQRMRAAGIRTPLVIDSSQWGTDINMLQAAGPNLIKQDPDRNLIFSVHAYWGGWSADAIWNEIEESATMELPLIIGEFAHQSVECLTPIDYDALLQAADAHEVGWYAWEWGPGNTPCPEMDMTSDDSFATLHGWGKDVALDHPSGIKATAKPVKTITSDSCG